MQISDNGLNLIKSQEGCVLHSYLDTASVPTIGYGTTYYPDGTKVTMHDAAIGEQQAEEYLQHVVNLTARAVATMVTVTLTQNQIDSLIDFAYNVGTGALHGSTLLRLVNANPADPKIRDAFMMWTKIHVDGQLKVSDDLVHRRKAEADLYFS
ncbi:MAG TPA: lysozyme [Puia sp.]|nr:lysozyme [Puia sp.]